MRPRKPIVGAGEILGYAQDVLDVACESWLNEKRKETARAGAEAAQHEAAAERSARLKKLAAESERLHEIDARIDLLLTLPPSEEKLVKSLVERLRRVRARIINSRNRI
jgi:hypothetical protein